MALPDEHLDYPARRHGQDIDRYDWRLSRDRPARPWPNGAALAAMIVIPVERFMLNPSGQPFRHPGAMATPWPDLRHYTSRDYGNRIGAFRLLRELAAAGLKANFAINAALLEARRPLVEAIAADGHEIAAHGWDTDSLHWSGLAPDDEARLVDTVRGAFHAAGLEPRAWLSPARQQSPRTPDLIRAAGFDICLDWESDSAPWSMRTDAGPLACVPLMNELDDRRILIEARQSEDEWAGQILAARDFIAGEAARLPGQMLSFTLTPWISGLPFRIHAVRRLLGDLAADRAVWTATAGAIADAAGGGA